MLNPFINSVYEHDENEENIYVLIPNTINVIPSFKGHLIFPTPHVNIKTCEWKIQIVFINKGEFNLITNDDCYFNLGCENYQSLRIHAGCPGYDTQPNFIYSSNLKKWIVNSNGRFDYGF